MAKAPTPHKAKTTILKSHKAIDEKMDRQQKQGKDFIYNSEGHGAGVIPETAWRKYKAAK